MNNSITDLLSSHRHLLDQETDALVAAIQKDERFKMDPCLSRGDTLRLLNLENENAFSDWLAWCLGRNGNREAIGNQLTGIFGDEFLLGQRFTVSREEVVEQGHDGQKGRLDLLLLDEVNKTFQVIEVKVRKPVNEELRKNAGYRKSILNRHPDWSGSFSVLTPNRHEDDLNDGFMYVSWSDVSSALRKGLMFRNGCNQYEAGIISCYVAAIESAILRFPVERLRSFIEQPSQSRRWTTGGDFLDYIRKVYGY
ncbi:MAG: hypothetical protein JNM39_16350 [Bdellovibrionaceae bacterium]|nr:hypothetical protein [Pseudobdellovibrionaceae bacterium]